MNPKTIEIPFYAKTTILLIGIFVLLAMLYIAQSIIVPLVFSFIIAIVLHPVVTILVRMHINRIVAICITLLITFIIIAALGTLLYSQALRFGDSWHTLVEKATYNFNQTIIGTSGYFNISQKSIHDWIAATKNEFFNTQSAAIGQTLLSVGNGVLILMLVPVYVFIILFYQPLLIEFVRRLFATNHLDKVNEIVTQTKSVIQRYLVGLVIEAVIVAALNITALMVLGIEYAILLGIIGALLNLIPYIGGIVGVALPMMVALATKSDPWVAFYVLIAYYIIQLIDNNLIITFIVSSKVKINALFSIIIVIAGNALWGISGMFLSIPLLAILKVIFDHIDELKPWGYLLGDSVGEKLRISKLKSHIKKTLTINN